MWGCVADSQHMSAAKETTLKELGEMLSHVVDHMATKGDIGALNETLADHSKALAEQIKILAAHTLPGAIEDLLEGGGEREVSFEFITPGRVKIAA
jgi:hypothetical protein